VLDHERDLLPHTLCASDKAYQGLAKRRREEGGSEIHDESTSKS